MYFALECFAKTRTGLVALNEPNHPRLGPLGASTIPRIWSRSINARQISVKRKNTLCAGKFLHVSISSGGLAIAS